MDSAPEWTFRFLAKMIRDLSDSGGEETSEDEMRGFRSKILVYEILTAEGFRSENLMRNESQLTSKSK